MSKTMTAFIREQGLLPVGEIDEIIATAPLDLIRFQDVAALIPLEARPEMSEWLDNFNAGAIALAA